MSKKDTKQEVKLNDNFQFKSILVSCNKLTDGEGNKNYRTVYAASEVNVLFADIELINRQFDKKNWEAEIHAELYRIVGDKAQSILQKAGKITIPQEADIFGYTISFEADELPDKKISEGVYVILIHINNEAAQTDQIFIMEGAANPASYFNLIKVGIDKVCEETDEESKQRPHSYISLNYDSLEDVRFYFMAENLLEQEWVYEFVVLLSHQNGMFKLKRLLRGNKFVSDNSGKKMLFSAIDFGLGIDAFWQKGDYTIHLLAFDQLVLKLDFSLGEKDIPYDYEPEIEAGGNTMTAHPSYVAIEETNKDEVLDKLYRLVGLRKIKEEITRISQYAEFIAMRQDAGFDDVFPTMHMMFSGNPGTGRHTIAGLLGELFHAQGILSHGQLNSINSSDFFSGPAGREELIVREILKANAGGVLYIENVAGFVHNSSYERGVVFLRILVELISQKNPDILVILSDEPEEMAALTELLPDLKRYFSKHFYFGDYSPEELMDITHQKLDVRQYRFTPAAEEKFLKLLKRKCADKGHIFENGHFVNVRLDEALTQMSKRLMSNGKRNYERDEMMLIQAEDIVLENELTPNNSFEKIDSVVKEKRLKQDLIKHLNYIYFVRERQKQGFSDVMPPLNMIFSGNTGTGRLTVAKMLGEIYYTAGLLSTPAVVVQNGYALASENGIPAEQAVAMLVNSAVGGILYIENASSMTQSEYGLAVFEGLLSSLSPDEFEDLIIILADSPSEFDRMLANNPGLKLYFPYQFDFMDYTPDELLSIAETKLKENNYTLHKKSREALQKLIEQTSGAKDTYIGNAVWVDKLVGSVIRNMSERTMEIRQKRELTRKELTTIVAEDIPAWDKKNPAINPNAGFDNKEIAEALKELDKIVGQNKIKKQIRDFVDLARHYAGQGIKLNTKMSLQWCFSGNSGMGKKAMARIIARLYKAMGIIDRDVVYTFKAEKLVGMTEEEALRYLGEILIKSKGGILLFDEDSKKLENIPGFRERIKAILVSQMIEIAGSYMIIYVVPQLTASDLGADVEKATDIVNVLSFEDYSDDELMLILKKKLADENMALTASARKYMAHFISMLNGKEERKHSSTRIMRIASELMIRNCLQRVSKSQKKQAESGSHISVVKSDVAMFNEDFIVNLVNERKKIGFSKA